MAVMILILAMAFAQSTGCRGTSDPIKDCGSDNQGEIHYNTRQIAADAAVWVCKDSNWVPYLLVPSVGLAESSSGHSRNQIKAKLSTSCTAPIRSGVYWVRGRKVYCDTEIDGGGWTMVWQHSYLEDLPLSTKMTYYSDYYKACTTKASGWCNIPNKARFGATEMMICAYHRKTPVYCYASLFNRLIDDNWRGAILSEVDIRKIVDKCTSKNGVWPAPQNSQVVGMTFDKFSSTDYKANCHTYKGSLTSPNDCRWENCHLPAYISGHNHHVQMTGNICPLKVWHCH